MHQCLGLVFLTVARNDWMVVDGEFVSCLISMEDGCVWFAKYLRSIYEVSTLLAGWSQRVMKPHAFIFASAVACVSHVGVLLHGSLAGSSAKLLAPSI